MKKKVVYSGVLLAILLLTSCSKATNSIELTTVRINSSQYMSYAPIFIADAEGYFAEFGIQLEMVPFEGTYQAVPLVISGDLDVYAGAVNAGLINTLYSEENIRVVADRGGVDADMECTFQGIVVRKDLYESGDVTGPADLEGRNVVAISPTGPTAYMFSKYLGQAGLTMNDVVEIDLPSSAYIDAMANGSIDAISTLELHISRLLEAGDTVVLAGAEDILGTFQTSVLAFGKNLLVDNPDLGVRFMAAYLKGVAQFNEGKTDRNLEILAEATGEDIDALKNACWMAIKEDGVPEFEYIVPFMNWAISQGLIEHAITEDQFWNPDFLEQAEALLEE